MGYVYKYVFNNEVIYVGKTKYLNQRIRSHGRPGDNIDEKFWDELKQSQVFVKVVEGDIATDFLETALINKYKPKCNKAKISDGFGNIGFEIQDPEDDWVLYGKGQPHISYRYVKPMQHDDYTQETKDTEYETEGLKCKEEEFKQKEEELKYEIEELKYKLDLANKKYQALLHDFANMEDRNEELERNCEALEIEKTIISKSRIETCKHSLLLAVNITLRSIKESLYRKVISNTDAWQLEGERKCFYKMLKAVGQVIQLDQDLDEVYQNYVIGCAYKK